MSSPQKRKRTNGEDGSQSATKKRNVSFAKDDLKISFTSVPDELPPVLAVPMGLSMPHQALKAYQLKTNEDVPMSERELLLHSSDHPRMDYIANEEFGNSAEKLVNHYIGVYDPKTGELELFKARKLAVRTSLRPTQDEINESSMKRDYKTMLSQRHNLGMEFGTKKAKKMITSLAENAILAANKPSAATKALMTSIGENIADMPTAEELAEAAEASKPRPRANIAAKEPVDVYPIETLIDEDTLYHIDIRDWLDATKQKKGVTTTSRYVSRRIQSVIQIAEEDPTKLKVLKYMLMVIEFFQALKKSKNGKLVPSYEVLKALKHPGFMMDGIRKRFSVDNMLSLWAIDNLMTHIMAMALYIDDFSVDTEDLKDDFRLTPLKAMELFRSIGCKVNAPTDREKAQLKLTTIEARNRKFARLVIPLDFPQDRKMQKRAKN